jgi:hypothetical protein
MDRNGMACEEEANVRSARGLQNRVSTTSSHMLN